MVSECNVRRYAGYFRGWCQAFGEHQSQLDEESGILWLFGETQVGLILSERWRRIAYRALLARKQPPPLVIGAGVLQAGNLRYAASSSVDRAGLESLRQLLADGRPVHLYLTYHFIYPRGTRIVTFSRKGPLPLVYKPITPLVARLI